MNYNEIKKKAILNAIDFEKSNYLLSTKLSGSFDTVLAIIDDYIAKALIDKVKDSVILKNVDSIMKKEFKNINDAYIKNIADIANGEYDKSTLLIASTLTTASVLKNKGVKNSDIYKNKTAFSIEAITSNKFFSVEFMKYENELKKSILKRVKSALVSNKSFKQAANFIYKDVSLKSTLSLGQVKTISRTMMKSIQSDAVNESLINNDIKYVKYISILDNRTTDSCKSLSNKVFRIKDAPKLPLHYNCRATLIMVAPWDVKEAVKDLISFKDWYNENKDDPDLKRLKYVY